MRRWMLAAVVAGMAHGAQAADLPDLSDLPVLRGGFTDGLSASTVNWQGAYVGGQVGYSSANMDFSNATSSLTNYMLQNLSYQSAVSGWTLLGKSSPTSTSFGGFVGWNSQWDDVVVGIEANYNRLSGLTGSSTNSLPIPINIPQGCLVPPPGDTDTCGIRLSGTASAKVTDVLTLRGRAGWAIGNFMPYMFGGLALGRAEITRTATINQYDSFYNATTGAYDYSVNHTQSQTQGGSGVFTYGYTAGVGLEAMLWGGVFARAEYEYVKFTNVQNIKINLNTVRAGLGYKF